MEWFNIRGLAFIAVIMIPNIVFAIKCKGGFANSYKNKTAEIIEQIGRIGCFVFMIFNIPGIVFGWWDKKVYIAYLLINTLLVVLYCLIWVVCWRRNNVFRALALSMIPSAVFLFSGVMCRSIPLIIMALLFAPAHILISYKNADHSLDKEET